MKFNELKNEQAIEALADMLDPIMEIASDKDITAAARENNRLLVVKLLMKNHAKEVVQLMAMLEGVPVEEYECNMLTLPAKIVELFNAPEFEFLFT